MKHIWSPDIPGQPRRLHISGAAMLKGLNFEHEHPVLRFVASDEETTYELSIEDKDSIGLLLVLAKQLKDREKQRGPQNITVVRDSNGVLSNKTIT